MTQGENPFRISGSRTDAEHALREVRQWLAPLPENALRRELVALHAITPSAKKGETDLELMLEIYVKKLQDFPGDVARDALQNWSGSFFPSWPELRDVIASDWRIRERRQRLDALRAFLNNEQDEKPSGPAPTPEQIARNEAYVREARGDNPAALSQEKLERLAEVDRVHGDAAKAKRGNWRKPPTPDTKHHSEDAG